MSDHKIRDRLKGTVLDLLGKGSNVIEITEITGLSNHNIRIIMRENGIKLATGPGKSGTCGDLPIEDVIALRAKGLTLQQVADRAGVSRERIRQVLFFRHANVKRKNKSDQIVEMLNEGKSVEDVCTELNVSTATIRNAKISKGIHGPLIEKPIHKLQDRDWLYDQYVTQEKSQEKIARELKASYMSVARWLNNHKIEIRERGEGRKTSMRWGKVIPIESLQEDRRNGLSMIEIARKIGCSMGTVIKLLKRRR